MIPINFDIDTFKALLNDAHIYSDIHRKSVANLLVRIYNYPKIESDDLGKNLMEQLPPRYLMETLSTLTSHIFISCINPADRTKFIEELYTQLTGDDIANAKNE